MRIASLPSNIECLEHTFVKRLSYLAGYYVDTTYESGQLTSWAYASATKERIGSPVFAHTVRDKYKLTFLGASYGRSGDTIVAWRDNVFRTFRVGDIIGPKDPLYEPANFEEWVAFKRRMYKNHVISVLATTIKIEPHVGKGFHIAKPKAYGRGTYTVREQDLIPLAKRYVK
jgi:hypothetical protein